MNINEDCLSALRMALALMVIGVSVRYPDRTKETTPSQRLGVGGHEEQSYWWILGTSPLHFQSLSFIFIGINRCPNFLS